MFAYPGIRNVSFLENFTYELNEWSLGSLLSKWISAIFSFLFFFFFLFLFVCFALVALLELLLRVILILTGALYCSSQCSNMVSTFYGLDLLDNWLTLPAQYILESCSKIKINLNFYLHISLWFLKGFYEGPLRPLCQKNDRNKIWLKIFYKNFLI